MREPVSRSALLEWMNSALTALGVPEDGAFFSAIHPMRRTNEDVPNWHVAYWGLRELPDDPQSALEHEPQIRHVIEEATARFDVDWDGDERGNS